MAEVRPLFDQARPIERYPHVLPYPRRLLLGSVGGRALPVVIADDTDGDETLVATVYEPDPALWQSGFRRRRRR